MKRGDLVTIRTPGDNGKPHPAVITQSETLDASDSVLIAFLTSTQTEAPLYRLILNPTTTNGLKSVSQIKVDKILAYPRQKFGPVLCYVPPTEILVLNMIPSAMIGFAG